MDRITRKAASIGLLAALAMALFGCRINPVTGQGELVLVTEAQEVSLGHQNHPNIVFMYDGEYHDPELNRYLGTIVMRLHECSHRPAMPMEFTMLNTSMINAFATPAHVYATRGFLARLENEAQFASVMGHELAHVAAGHSARRLTNAMAMGLVFGVADQAIGDSALARTALGAGQVGVTLLGLSYSREQERQADRVGTYYTALAGWDPREAIAMQKLLESFGQNQPGFLDRYLSTHPETENRVTEIEAVINEKDLSSRYRQGDGIYAARWRRRLERLREVDRAFAPYDRGMRLLDEKKFDQALAAANEALRTRDDQAQFHRLKGDALLGLGLTAEAKAAYNESLERDGRYVLANIGLGRAYLAEGNAAAAEREFEKAARGFPGGVVGQYGLGIARLNQGKHAEAVDPLRRTAAAVPQDPNVRYALAVCYDELGEPALAYQAYGEALEAGLTGTQGLEAQRRLDALQPVVAPPQGGGS